MTGRNDTEAYWNGKPAAHWIGIMQHPGGESRWQAVDALRHLCRPSESIPHFIAALLDDHWRARALAAHALHDLAFDEANHALLLPAIEPLSARLADDSVHVALNASYTLELLGPKARLAIPALKAAIDRGDEELCQAAKDALRTIAQ